MVTMLRDVAFAIGLLTQALPASLPPAAARDYAPVPRSQCLALDGLSEDERTLAASWLQDALDSEALYTVLAGIKPVSSGVKSFRIAIAAPDLTEIDRARRITAALRCGDSVEAHVHLFAVVNGGERFAEVMFVNRPALDGVLDAKRAFFAPLGLSPGTPPLQVLGVVEHLPRSERYRALGYLFGFPDYAVDFFVQATVPGAEVGPGKDRQFHSIPVYREGRNAFVWAVPLAHETRAEDRSLANRAAPVLTAYRRRRAEFVGDGKPGVAALVRDWLCDDADRCGADRAARGLDKRLAAPPP
jgi:hypothetical protein